MKRILEARIDHHPWGLSNVVATMDDGTTEAVFAYYPDELRFTASEFTGLTIDEAVTLRHKRDVGYLRS